MTKVATKRDVGFPSSYDACAFVDALGADAVGEIAVSGAEGPRGIVFVESGRVCWAAARGLAPRLTELLAARAALAPNAMEELFRACRARGAPLGEHLVETRLLDAQAFRDALLQHTAESLALLCTESARAAWRPRSGKGYSPRFTFATAELLAHVGATRHGETAARVRPILDASFEDGDWAAAFVRPVDAAFPEPIALFGSAPGAARVLLRVGKWAASVLDVVATFSDESALYAVARPARAKATAIVAFRHGGVVVAGETSAYGPARLLNLRAQARRSPDSGRRDADL
ncbi:MAG: hypothetical protein KF819_06880 [Labilithrix sp.]|nr:hypothetical protein [Labilithrix sp.]